MPKYEVELRPTFWANISGGKDSFYMLYLILQNPQKYPLDGVVYFDLETDYPFIKDVVDFIERECKKYGIPIMRIKPRTAWMDYYSKYEYPTRRARWCNSMYKLDCKKQLEQMMKAQGKRVVHYIGFCADESKRFKEELNSTNPMVTQIYPLAEMGVMEDSILEWAKQQPLYNDFYKVNRRCGCVCCPMASMTELLYTKTHYPKEFNHYMELARQSEKRLEIKKGKPLSMWSGNPKYNTEYKVKRLEQMEQKQLCFDDVI